MKYLSINRNGSSASFLVFEDQGMKCGTLRHLEESEVQEFALWIGKFGGRDLLDDFELALINSKVLRVAPLDEDGGLISYHYKAMEFLRESKETRILWEVGNECEECDGTGLIEEDASDSSDDNICLHCDGNGSVWTGDVVTDIDGNLTTT